MPQISKVHAQRADHNNDGRAASQEAALIAVSRSERPQRQQSVRKLTDGEAGRSGGRTQSVTSFLAVLIVFTIVSSCARACKPLGMSRTQDGKHRKRGAPW